MSEPLAAALADFRRMMEANDLLHRKVMLYESFLIPRDAVYYIDGARWVHPSMMLMVRNGGRMPLLSRFTVGQRELDRDRRRYG